MSVADLRTPSYTWRGSTYKSMSGLFKALLRVYPQFSMSFDLDTMYLKNREGSQLEFHRSFDAQGNSIIEDDPIVDHLL